MTSTKINVKAQAISYGSNSLDIISPTMIEPPISKLPQNYSMDMNIWEPRPDWLLLLLLIDAGLQLQVHLPTD